MVSFIRCSRHRPFSIPMRAFDTRTLRVSRDQEIDSTIALAWSNGRYGRSRSADYARQRALARRTRAHDLLYQPDVCCRG
jgi:hypothetical protein